MMDPASIHAAGVAFKALLDKVGEAVTGANRPQQIRKLASAHAYATREIAAAEADQALIEARTEIQIKEEREAHRDRQLHRALMRAEAEALRHQENIEQVVEKARPLLVDSSQPSAMDNDWVANVLEHARNVSDEDMQHVWARLLAGEANSRGSFSRRTVNILDDMDKDDCEVFANLCNFAWRIVEDPVPLIYGLGMSDKFYRQRGVTFDIIRHLESIGLVQHFPNGVFKGELPRYVSAEYQGEKLVLDIGEQQRVLGTGLVMFTNVGEELSRICDAKPVDGFVDYVKQMWTHYLPPAGAPSAKE